MRAGLYLTGGAAKGAKLFSIPGKEVRPATARVRISLFDVLRSRVEGARVADLFAGTGSLGLEALSRGAASCVFFDTDPRAEEVLRRNVEKLRWTSRAEIRRTSAFEAAVALPSPVDLVFVDPPYAYYTERREALFSLGRDLVESGKPAPGGMIVVEHPPGRSLGVVLGGLPRIDERTYGGTVLSFYGPSVV